MLNQQEAATRVQRAWRSFTNRRIYKYYRDIIYFKCKGNPARLLKGINPNEAQLLQRSSNAYVRFRLGGETFPPNIYYKIFSVGKVIDINAFAPRDYSTIPRLQQQKRLTFDQYQERRNQYQHEGWYLRVDNNGWRPISHKMFVKLDQVELKTANKVRYYHHSKQKRQQKCQKKRRLAKLRWLQQLYSKARQEQDLEQESDEQKLQVPAEYNPLKDPKFVQCDQDQFDKQVKELIEWSQSLDYDAYLKDWFQLSVSKPSGYDIQ